MISMESLDTSFFEVEIRGDTKKKTDIEGVEISRDDVISFNIVEEMGKMLSGSISFYDPDFLISKKLRVGIPLKIKWGYRVPDIGIKSLFISNPDEVQGAFEREGIYAIVQSPSGTLGSDGSVIFNCNFYGSYYLGGGRANKVFRVGNKTTVIKEVFRKLNIEEENIEVDFARGSEVITKDTQVIQNESNFRFLLKMSREWNALFRIGFTEEGDLYGLFIDYQKLEKSKFNLKTTSAISGNTITLNYRGTTDEKDINPNVSSATWQNHAGDSGYGDNVQITLIHGKPVFTRFVTQGESVTAWRLNPEAIEKELRKQKNFSSRLQLMKTWLSADDFEDVKRFFIKVTDTTAPQGLGYSMKAKMIGNPMVTTPMKVRFGSGFPPFFLREDISFYVNKVTHNIDSSGYTMDVEIADYYTITGGAFV